MGFCTDTQPYRLRKYIERKQGTSSTPLQQDNLQRSQKILQGTQRVSRTRMGNGICFIRFHCVSRNGASSSTHLDPIRHGCLYHFPQQGTTYRLPFSRRLQRNIEHAVDKLVLRQPCFETSNRTCQRKGDEDRNNGGGEEKSRDGCAFVLRLPRYELSHWSRSMVSIPKAYTCKEISIQHDNHSLPAQAPVRHSEMPSEIQYTRVRIQYQRSAVSIRSSRVRDIIFMSSHQKSTGRQRMFGGQLTSDRQNFHPQLRRVRRATGSYQ